MTCDDFLARYSEFVDDRLPLPEVVRMRRHVRECASCGDYDRVVTQGRRALQALPTVEPSSSFYRGLHGRLAEAKPASGPAPVSRSAGPGALVTLSVASLVAAIAWSPLLQDEPPTIELPAMAAKGPVARASLNAWSALPRLMPGTRSAATWWSGPGVDVPGSLGVSNASARSLSGSALFSPMLLTTDSAGSRVLPASRVTFE